MDLVSIIIPFLNEEECISKCCQFVDEFSLDKPYRTEVIFVDDGSTDKTVELISSYDFQNSSVKLVQLSKNHGSHAAIRAGILHSSGDYLTYICADLQEPDDMISVMYNKITDGFDAVYIEKKSIGVSRKNRAFSLTYSWLMRKYAAENYSKGGINNIMFNKKIRDYLNNNIERNSSLMLQIIDSGFKSCVIPMSYDERIAGVSKWTLSKKMKLFIDSFVAFSYAPIRMVSILGLLMFLFGLLFLIGVIISSIVYPDVPVGYPTLAAILVMGFGITNISLGIIAEYLWRTFDAARDRPCFIISEIKEIK